MNERHRRPAAFRLDDPDVVVTAEAGRAAPRHRAGHGRARAARCRSSPNRLRCRGAGFAWATLFWSALGGLAVLGLGLGVTRLIEDLFDRNAALGWLGAAACRASPAVALRGDRRCAKPAGSSAPRQHREAAPARRRGARQRRPHRRPRRGARCCWRCPPHAAAGARRGRGSKAISSDIIDGADLVRLAERELMEPLDHDARRIVSAAAKRVSLVTAVSPRAAVDMLFVLVTALRLVRRLAYLYGGRPGTLGVIRLMREVIAHLALTGGMAAGDSVIQQVLGHGIAAKVSVRLGEGVLNGLLTARVGLAAIEVTRPLPFAALPPPTLADVAGHLLRRRGESKPEMVAAENP